MKAIACVFIEDFSLPNHRTAHALVDYNRTPLRVAAVSAPARAAGVEPGMTLTRAIAKCPSLREERLQQHCIDEMRDRVLDKLWALAANDIEVDADSLPQSGIFWLDLGPTKDADAVKIAENIRQSLGRLNLVASVGIATSKFAAYAAARFAEWKVRLIPEGTEAAFLAPLPLTLLPIGSRMLQRLQKRYRTYTLGRFASFSRSFVLSHFGRRGVTWYRQASGRDERRVRPFPKPPVERTPDAPFNSPVTAWATLEYRLEECADLLAARIAKKNIGVQSIALTIIMTRATRVERAYRLVPVTDASELFRILVDLLEGATIDSPVEELSVTLRDFVPIQLRQLELFETPSPLGQRTLNFVSDLEKRHGECAFTALLVEPTLVYESRVRFVPVKRERAS